MDNARHETSWSGVLFGVALGWLAAYQYFKLPPALPLLMERYGYAPLAAGSYMSVFALAGLLISSWVSHRFRKIGAGRTIAVALGIALAGNLLGLLHPASALTMLMARSLEGVSYAILAVVGVVLAVSAAAPEQRALAVGLWATWIPAGQLAASFLAALSIDQGSWQWLWIAGMVMTVFMGIWARWLWVAGILGSSEVSPGMPRDGPHVENAYGSLVLASAVLFALWSGQFIAFMTWLPQFLVETHQLSLETVAFSYAVVPAFIVVFNLVAGVALQAGVRIGTLLVPSLAVQTLVWLLIPEADGLTLGLLCLVVYGIASGLIPTCLFSLPGTITAHVDGQARAFGILMSGRNVGALAGPVLLPQMLVWMGQWQAVAVSFGVIMGIAVILACFLMSRLQNRRCI